MPLPLLMYVFLIAHFVFIFMVRSFKTLIRYCLGACPIAGNAASNERVNTNVQQWKKLLILELDLLQWFNTYLLLCLWSLLLPFVGFYSLLDLISTFSYSGYGLPSPWWQMFMLAYGCTDCRSYACIFLERQALSKAGCDCRRVRVTSSGRIDGLVCS
jgi:hypothetical protein